VAVNKTSVQRIIIWIIAITMTVGSLGAYFLIILQNKDTTQAQTNSQKTADQQPAKLSVDPTAFKVEGKVSELQVTDLKVGDGAEVKTGDNIKVHYKGTLAQSGEKFGSSYDNGEPPDIPLAEGHIIKGWLQGVPGMKVGGKRRLVIPADLAYGATGRPEGGIPPDTDLVFEMEVLAINPPKPQ